MLFLPPQTTKLCAHWWCHSKKNLATCYSKQVLVPVYCSKKPNPINIFLFFSPLFLFYFIFFLSAHLFYFFLSAHLSLSLSLSLSALPTQAATTTHLSSLFVVVGFFFVCFHMGLVAVLVAVVDDFGNGFVDFGCGGGG